MNVQLTKEYVELINFAITLKEVIYVSVKRVIDSYQMETVKV